MVSLHLPADSNSVHRSKGDNEYTDDDDDDEILCWLDFSTHIVIFKPSRLRFAKWIHADTLHHLNGTELEF